MTPVDKQNYDDIARYALRRDPSASIRLYFQHWMWQRELGYLLHPEIRVTDGMRIADVACGTGIWLLDLAKKYPKVKLHGYDISSAQFPPLRWLPANVQLENIDILKPVPEELQGTYDVVHVGLIVLVVQKDDPTPILENLISLLKPGGYLQWEEADFGKLQVASTGPDVSHEAMQGLADKVHGFMLSVTGHKYVWVQELSSYFKKKELRVLADRNLPIPDDIAFPWTLQHLMASVELISSVDQPPGAAADWWELYDHAAEEAIHGTSMRMNMISVLGRKPGWIEVTEREYKQAPESRSRGLLHALKDMIGMPKERAKV